MPLLEILDLMCYLLQLKVALILLVQLRYSTWPVVTKAEMSAFFWLICLTSKKIRNVGDLSHEIAYIPPMRAQRVVLCPGVEISLSENSTSILESFMVSVFCDLGILGEAPLRCAP